MAHTSGRAESLWNPLSALHIWTHSEPAQWILYHQVRSTTRRSRVLFETRKCDFLFLVSNCLTELFLPPLPLPLCLSVSLTLPLPLSPSFKRSLLGWALIIWTHWTRKKGFDWCSGNDTKCKQQQPCFISGHVRCLHCSVSSFFTLAFWAEQELTKGHRGQQWWTWVLTITELHSVWQHSVLKRSGDEGSCWRSRWVLHAEG